MTGPAEEGPDRSDSVAQKVMFVFGTRPEAIKLAPVILHARSRPADFSVRVCVTAQHRQMLDQVLGVFGIAPDVDLNIMKPNQDLFDITAAVVTGMKPVLRAERPDWILVQGDTTTVWAAALAAFYEGIRVGHVEAGLRTFDKRQPFPEEINRRLCTQLADLHFAPTPRSRQNLLDEHIPDRRIVVTGNTVVDALLWMVRRLQADPPADVAAIRQWAADTFGNARMVLITGHRRESFGEGFEHICKAIRRLSETFQDVHWVYPVHLNPNVQEPVKRILSRRPNVHLVVPQPYAPFTWLMQRSTLILTDSGGIQEEAPSLGKFVLVMRNTTERPEGVEAGCVALVGNDEQRIVDGVAAALADPGAASGTPRRNPYGDGHASERIAEAILKFAE